MEGMVMNFDFDFYKGKRVLVTGDSGFKGSWLCHVLLQLGADVYGYSLTPPTSPNLFEKLKLFDRVQHVTGDIRNFSVLKNYIDSVNPEIIFHLAAQPLVRKSYQDPLYTYATNVMGTVNILECVRLNDSVKSFVNITTDKVYKNNEWTWGYRENDVLNGYDPYSNSKSCSELVTNSYLNSFFNNSSKAISTVRAGNVIGGGDFAEDRIIPDCVRHAIKHASIEIRNPQSVRPYQHVLEPIVAYMLLAQKQYKDEGVSGSYNIGPDDVDCVSTGQLVDIFCNEWGNGVNWYQKSRSEDPHEANFLKLDCSKFKKVFDWSPRWHVTEAVHYTCLAYKSFLQEKDIFKEIDRQIEIYFDI